ncbi:MAG: hypothetical protein ACK5KP_09785 [Paludibacteraceae bacterium]
MNKAFRLIGLLTGSLVTLTLIALVVFYSVGLQYKPVNFWLIPVFFGLLIFVLALIVNKYIADKKELSIGSIFGIRVFFISLIAVFIIINMLIDRESILSFTITSVVFALIFSYFETKILLVLNQKDKKKIE